MAAHLEVRPVAIPMGGQTPKRSSYTDFIHVYSSKASAFMFRQFDGFRHFTVNAAKSGLTGWERFSFWAYNRWRSWSRRWFTHFFLLLLISLYLLAGSLVFMVVEGLQEEEVAEAVTAERKNAVRKVVDVVKRFGSYEDDRLIELVDQELRDFEKLVIDTYKDGYIFDGSDQRVWTFWNSAFFCGSILTTVGFGHPSPATMTGRAVTVAYATIGIPVFLIFLAHFGNLFSRVAKSVWNRVRWVFRRSGRQRTRHHTVFVQVRSTRERNLTGTDKTSDATEELETAFDYTSAPSAAPSPWMTDFQDAGAPPATSLFTTVTVRDDHDYDLPVSVAVFLLFFYICCGAAVVCTWGSWGFVESFYFVFISMTTIGLGDFVPHDPLNMMAVIIYLVFGLALASMCVHVVMGKLSDSFHEAVVKIGATIGVEVEDEDEERENTSKTSGAEEKAVVRRVKSVPRIPPELNVFQSSVQITELIH